MKKLIYEAPVTETIQIGAVGVILTSLTTNAPSSTGPANIDSNDIHSDGSLW